MIKIERKTKTLVIPTVLVLAILSGIALVAYADAKGVTNDTSTTANVTYSDTVQYCAGARPFFGGRGFEGGRGMPPGGMRGRGCFDYGFIEVSEEFEQNVIKIAQNDTDVQSLLNEGYNITAVKPIIKTIVEGDGTVVTKATSAILIMEKDTAGRAFVWVDLEQEKVTRIEILTITVIEKS